MKIYYSLKGASFLFEKIRSVAQRFTIFLKASTLKLSIVLLFFVFKVNAQSSVTLNSGNSWQVPCGVTSVTVECWGGGGGGGNVTGTFAEAGGGSGGGYVRRIMTVTPNSSITYSIGNGGSGSGSGAAKNGGSTWFVSSATLLAVGGNGATNVAADFTSGSGALSPNTGNVGGTTTSSYGGSGGNGGDYSGYKSGGGGSSGGTTPSGNSTSNVGGIAPTNGYAGAQGVSGITNGNVGNIGAGGSGAATTNSTNRTGGSGGPGQIRITYNLAHGDNVWNVYAWNGGNTSGGDGAWVTDYRGFYTNSNLNFDSTTHWGVNASPSAASGWVGCSVDVDNASFSAKRRGFPEGCYTIDLTKNDDYTQLYVNDVLVYTRTTYNPNTTPITNIWSGSLGPNDTVELRVSEGNVSWTGALQFNLRSAPPLASAYGNNVWNVHAWNGGNASGEDGAWLTNYRGFYTNNNLNFDSTTNWNANASPSAATGWTGCSVDVDNASFSAMRRGFPCGYYSIDLNKNDDYAQLYVNNVLVYTRTTVNPNTTPITNIWSGLLGPNDTVEFRVSEGPGNWTGAIQFNIVNNVPTSTLAYGSNVWNVYGWNGGNISGGDGAWSQDYRGFYVNSNLDFNTVAHWGINTSPSSAIGWTGCTVDVNNFSFAAKRQGFPCGIYRIDVLRNDDLAELYINDVLVWNRVDWSGDGATPASNLNVWTGTLGPNDRIEFRISEGEGGADGHITLTPIAATAPTITGPPSNVICSGTSTTLTAGGSNVATNASTLWFEGAVCPTIGFVQEFETMPYTTGQTNLNSVNSGILNLTSQNISPADAGFSMENIFSSAIDPAVQRYISMRYRVVTGTAIMTEVYFKKNTQGLAEDKVVRGNLISDTNWHVLSIDMGVNGNWNNTGGNITGWRFDYTTGANVMMQIDYIVLASRPVMENTAANDASILVTPLTSPASYTVVKTAESACGTISPCVTTQIYLNKTWVGGTGNWNVAANWLPSGVPTINDCVVGTSGTITVQNGSTAKNVTLSGTSSINVPTPNTITIADFLNTSATSGTFTLQNNASLVQVNNVANAGNISAIRNAKPMERYDFTYWSAPVAGQNLQAFSPLTFFDKYYSWNAATGVWFTYNFGNGTMNVGSGYAIRAPQTFSTTVAGNFSGTFTGVPNNGEVTVPGFIGSTTVARWNLIGNPYPSAIDIKLFLTDPDNTEVGGTIYLWTHNTPPSSAIPGNQNYNYTSDDYAAYNFVGGVATASPAIQNPTDPTDGDDNMNTLVNGHVASGQAFFIRGVKNTEDIAPNVGGPIRVKFRNSMRIAGNNANFFKPGPAEPINNWETTGQHRFWLNLENSQGAFNQTLVGYVENATNGLDRLYDGEVFGGNYVTIYSLLEQHKLTIQGKALPFNDQDIVPIGYKTTIAGTFNINLHRFDGLFEGQNIYLKDKLLNVVHDIKESAYSFTSAIGTFDSRFEIVYQSQALDTETPEINPESIIIYKDKDASVVVNAGTLLLNEIRVYDVAGRLLYESKNVNNSEAVIRNLPQTQQVLIVDVLTTDGFKTSKKVIF